MARSGFDLTSYNWPDEYYQVTLRTITDFAFTQRTFAPRSALVARHVRDGYREEVEYHGQPFDASQFELVEGRWDHEHCAVCRFRLEPGHSFWENTTGMLLCDVCHDHVQCLR
jgi:hypothetical protein